MNVFAKRTARKQFGAALLAFLLVFVTAASFALLKDLNATATKSYRDMQTSRALAEAKAALIGYAASVTLSGASRPGDLPCPDINNDGEYRPPVEGSCNNQARRRVGRLPWKSLGLPDLRDGSGERLWYAVSSNFRVNSRTPCNNPGDVGCLNSDTRGTITVRDFDGNILHDGSNPGDPYIKSGAVAVIIAPGAVLQRQGSGSSQNRGCAPGACSPTNIDVCTSSPPTNTAKCNRVNFVDWISVAAVTEDNQNFSDGAATDGFIQGDIRDANGNVIVNDRILPITYDDIMEVLERRVVGEVLNCLKEYAGLAANTARYPWAARPDEADINKPEPDFIEDSDVRFGRLPDTPFAQSPTQGMDASWGSNCKLSAGNWWLNWKEHIFYAVADAHQPSGTPPCPPGTCLMVDPPAPSPDKQAVVILAGKPLPDIDATGYDQDRRDLAKKLDEKNYLEAENADTPAAPYDDLYTAGPVPTPFNDIVCKNGACL